MKAVILAAGYATRLYPLTKMYPKPLLKVKRRPIIDYIIDKLQGLDGLDEILVVSNNKFFRRFQAWQRRHPQKKKIRVVNDLTCSNADRLGAIGDADFAITKRRLACDVLVIGGDNIFDGDLEAFLAFARSKKKSPVIGAYDIGRLSDARHYGVLKTDARHRVTDFQEKPAKPTSRLVAMCLYYFPAQKLRLIKEYMRAKDTRRDATGLYIDWLRKKVTVYAFVFGGRWYDIGDHEFYRKAQTSFVK
ncbi:MAG: nucleotidyltransferase family protein [Candidatus Omnitrophica bacterium]|nr:nucleotidyltransferase family protein [Candidatus Omnitrophota bacterium]